MRAKAATLAVGTEVTDGQILDRNSGWISQRLVDAGIEVIEHRAVADDRADITRALNELAERVDLLFCHWRPRARQAMTSPVISSHPFLNVRSNTMRHRGNTSSIF